ncbi:MAG: hypothetical protein QOH49_3301 [Acidobacteriota bacterium]|jgi:hypothetical protein|nr:hypothetical protein [Acidobacteriota bacterium]
MHGRRAAYYVVGEKVGENILSECQRPGDAKPDRVPALRFGRLFGRTQHEPDDVEGVVQKLVRLGNAMNDDKGNGKADSDISAGYTYLGQFIAHEVTHDSTGDLLTFNLQVKNLRTPEIDLDSLYGGEEGPTTRPELYRTNGFHLRTRDTLGVGDFTPTLPYDLPRGTLAGQNGNKEANAKGALLGDARNDENLAVAQTHVAFIHFHNAVASRIREEHQDYSSTKVFALAREEVIRHYQWVILYDFLPQIVRADVLDCVMRHGRRWFKGGGEDGLFMPLEFSAAAFRIGHTMVRGAYDWNPLRRKDSDRNPAPLLIDLFQQTGFLKDGLDGRNSLKGDWIIDWRHFFDFSPLNRYQPVEVNLSGKLDTVFDMHLNTVTGFPDEQIDKMQRAITVRNLLRGFYLYLPTGEEAAEWMGETPLTHDELAVGPHAAALDDPDFKGKTPLWYYVLREAELWGYNKEGKPGNRLGPVGSRIVAETLVALIENSPISIIQDKDWRPTLGRRANDATGQAKFEMIDLLDFANVVSPVAERRGELYLQQP